MSISLFMYGAFKGTTKTLTRDGMRQVEETSKYLRGLIKPGESVMIFSSPRDWEMQTAVCIREVLSREDKKNHIVGIKSWIKLLEWLYVLKDGHIIVDNQFFEGFIAEQIKIYDHIIIIGSTEHIEGLSSLITGKHGIHKVPNGHCVTIGRYNKISYSKKATPGPLLSQTGSI